LTHPSPTPIFLWGGSFQRMSSTPFGEHLKREREMRGVSLEEISLATRIAPRFLAALEKEEWEKLPGGVFNRGFIRSVAHYLGLDEDSMVAEYALHTKGRPEPGVVADPPMSRKPSGARLWFSSFLPSWSSPPAGPPSSIWFRASLNTCTNVRPRFPLPGLTLPLLRCR
jgi:transcriptional regulator with XRE-family HTH domain